MRKFWSELTLMRHIYAALSAAILLALAGAAAAPASAQHSPDVQAAAGQRDGQRQGPLRIESAWARATPSGAKVGGAFITLVNTGDAADRLVSASTAIAERVELHTHVMDGNVMRMREVEGGIALPPGETVKLQPGGFHVMLLGLKQGLAAGSRFPLTLTFAKAGNVQVEVPVEAIGSMGPGGHAGKAPQ
jgi:copper(I)-binding protein